jgi:hypothetical protein
MSHGGHDCGSACAHGFNLSHTQTLDELDFERGVWTAALENDVQRLRSLLDKGHCVNKTDKYGYTALVGQKGRSPGLVHNLPLR